MRDYHGKQPVTIHLIGFMCFVVLIFSNTMLPNSISALIDPMVLLVAASAPVFLMLFRGHIQKKISCSAKNSFGEKDTYVGSLRRSGIRSLFFSFLWSTGPLYFLIINAKHPYYAITTVTVLTVILSFTTVLWGLAGINQFACHYIKARGKGVAEGLNKNRVAFGQLFDFDEAISSVFARYLNPWRLILLTLIIIFLQYRYFDASGGPVVLCAFVVVLTLSFILYAAMRFSIANLKLVLLIDSCGGDHASSGLKEVGEILTNQQALIDKLWMLLPSLYLASYYLIYK